MILILGLLISFLGQLPIGYINLIALKVGLEKSVKQAIWFGIGVTLIELIYLTAILYGISFVLGNDLVYKIIQLTTALIFIVVAVVILIKWKKAKKEMKTTTLAIPNNAFFNGVFLSATNFAQVPFWVIWVSYLIEIKLLVKTTLNYQLFIWGSGFGTFLGILVYIFLGKKLLNKYKTITQYLDIIIAFFLLIAAGFQIARFLKTVV